MKSVLEINISPVKSLGLVNAGTVHVGTSGIMEDRRLFLLDNRDRLVTQREMGRLTRVALRSKDGWNSESRWQPSCGAAM